MHSFTINFLGYHHFKISQEDHNKTTFVIEWCSFAYTVMPFGWKNALDVFSKLVVVMFKNFIHKFLEVYLDDWIVLKLLKHHIQLLRLMLDQCHQLQIYLKIKKCIFCTPFGVLLGHIIYKDRLLMDLSKIGSLLTYPL